MIVINFSDSTIYLKGQVLASGVNILNNTPISEADSSEIIGIGENALRHYNALSMFWECEGFCKTTQEATIKRIHEQIVSITDQMKDLARDRAMLGGEDIKAKISALKAQKDKKIAMLTKLFSRIEIKELNDGELARIEVIFSTTQSGDFSFKQSKYALQAMETIRNTKKQTLPYQLYKYKKLYNV